jgi:hypothetical protein
VIFVVDSHFHQRNYQTLHERARPFWFGFGRLDSAYQGGDR